MDQPASSNLVQEFIQKLNIAIELARNNLRSFPESAILQSQLSSIRTKAIDGNLLRDAQQSVSLGLSRFVLDWAPLNSPIVGVVGEIESIYQQLILHLR
jgi:hypothetical protein